MSGPVSRPMKRADRVLLVQLLLISSLCSVILAAVLVRFLIFLI